MRVLLMLLASLLLFGSGCVEDSAPADDGAGNEAGNETAPPEPPVATIQGPQEAPNQNFRVTGGWQAATDAQNAAGQPICSLQTQDCHIWDFQVNKTLTLTARLEWGQDTSDLDLYLYQNGVELSRDGINSIGELPGTMQILTHDVTPGTYQLYVVPWNAVRENYELRADFS